MSFHSVVTIVVIKNIIGFQTPELTAEEQEQRLKKAEAIRKMLSETTVTAPDGSGVYPNSLSLTIYSIDEHEIYV